MITDHWGPGISLRELGTKPFLFILFLFILVKFIFGNRTISFNKNYFTILIILIVLCVHSVGMNGTIAINQSILLIFVFAVLSVNQIGNINPSRVINVFLIGHLFFLSLDLVFDLSYFRNIITEVINLNPNARGLFTEHSWSAMIVGALPLYYLNKPSKFYAVFLFSSLYVIILVNSGTGIASLLLSAFLFLYGFMNKGKLKFFRILLAIFVGISIIALTFNSNRFSIDYNESNATRLLIPFYLAPSGLENYCLGVGINGQLQYLIENNYSGLSFLNEFENAAKGLVSHRFNSFNLYIRLWSSFGILGLLFSIGIIQIVMKNLFSKDNQIVILSLITLISTLSNDSFNNVFLILLIISNRISKNNLRYHV